MNNIAALSNCTVTVSCLMQQYLHSLKKTHSCSYNATTQNITEQVKKFTKCYVGLKLPTSITSWIVYIHVSTFFSKAKLFHKILLQQILCNFHNMSTFVSFIPSRTLSCVHMHTHTQSDYCNPSWACRLQVNYSIKVM